MCLTVEPRAPQRLHRFRRAGPGQGRGAIGGEECGGAPRRLTSAVDRPRAGWNPASTPRPSAPRSAGSASYAACRVSDHVVRIVTAAASRPLRLLGEGTTPRARRGRARPLRPIAAPDAAPDAAPVAVAAAHRARRAARAAAASRAGRSRRLGRSARTRSARRATTTMGRAPRRTRVPARARCQAECPRRGRRGRHACALLDLGGANREDLLELGRAAVE